MRTVPNAARALWLVSTAALVALTAAFSCGGLTKGTPVTIPGGPIVVVGSDAGPDAGLDGGPDGGADAGPDAGPADGGPDAGCTSLTTLVVDGCFSSHTLQLITTGCGSISISLDQTPVCSGTLGNNDSFLGVCGAPPLGCQASSLPGTIVCAGGPDAGGCNIVVCPPNGACPP